MCAASMILRTVLFCFYRSLQTGKGPVDCPEKNPLNSGTFRSTSQAERVSVDR